MKKFMKIAAFLLLLSAAVVMVYKPLQLKNLVGAAVVKEFYEEKKDTCDILFLGSSHNYWDINPTVLWKNYGMAGFVFGGPGQPVPVTYHFLLEALKTQRPKLAVVELFKAAQNNNPQKSFVQNLIGFKYSRNKLEALKTAGLDNTWEVFFEIPLAHTRYTELEKNDFEDETYREANFFKGHKTNFRNKKVKRPDVGGVTASVDPAPLEKEYILKIIEKCKQEEIPLLFIVTPYKIEKEHQKIFNGLEKLSAEYGVPFLNLNKDYEAYGLDFGKDFFDNQHLNYKGSEKLTSYLGQYIHDNYEIPDRRGDADYVSWEETAIRYQQKINGIELREEKELGAYLKKLQNPDWLYAISFQGQFEKSQLSEEVKIQLKELGIKEDMLNLGSVFLNDSGKTSYFPVMGGDVYQAEDLKDEFVVKQSREEDGIISTHVFTEKTDCYQGVSGIQIVVWDKVKKDPADCVTFDNTQGFRAFHRKPD